MRPHASPLYSVCTFPRFHTVLAVCQFLCNILPGHTALYHQHHGMIQEIRHLVLNLLRIRVLSCDYQLRTLFSYFFQDLINTFVKQIVGVRTFLRMLFPVFDDLIYIFKDFQRIDVSLISFYTVITFVNLKITF